MKSCLITGGAGFIGSRLAAKMLKKGWQVKIIDNLTSGKPENLKSLKKKVDFFKVDIRDLAALKKLPLKADVIIHLAALVSVPQSFTDPQKTLVINFYGTKNILAIAKKLKIKKIIFASTSAVYGDLNKEMIKETDPVHPLSPYALSKLKAEKALSLASQKDGLKVVVLRFFNVYGPGQDAHSPYCGVIAKFLEKMKKGRRPVIYGDGKQTRDFLYVDDAVNAILKAVAVKKSFSLYNAGAGQTVSVNKLLSLLNRLLFKDKNHFLKAFYRPAHEGDILFSGAKITKIKKELKFEPKYDLREGLKKMAQI